MRRAATIAAALLLAFTAAAPAAARDPGRVGSVYRIDGLGNYVCYVSGRACDFHSDPLRVGTPSRRTLAHVTINVHATLGHRDGSELDVFGTWSSTRQAYYVLAFGSVRDGGADSYHGGQLIGSGCINLGTGRDTQRWTSTHCARHDKSKLHHSGMLYFRFVFGQVPGYYYLCHVYTPVARFYRGPTGGHYEFTGASNVAGSAGDHVTCRRHPNVGLRTP